MAVESIPSSTHDPAPDQPIASGGAAVGIEPGAVRPDPVTRPMLALVVGIFVLIGHAASIDTGLYLDDHLHYQHLHDESWSFRSAVEASRLGIVGDVLDLWGRQEAPLRFFRPIAFWIMKIEYTLAGWRPLPMHLFSLGWHYLCAMLVAALAMRCFGRRVWAATAGCLVAIHPGHMATVYWVACQTELITTAFLLIGILAYARHAGWGYGLFLRNLPWARGEGGGAHERGGHGPPDTDSSALSTQHSSSHRPVTGWSLLALLCYGLALGCRENAVLFPLVCWTGDRLCGTTRRGKFRWEHAAMLGLLAGYFVLRTIMLGGFPLPPKPYLMPVTDPDFPRYFIEKAAVYTISLFGFIPLVPIGGQLYFAQRPTWFYGGLGMTVVGLLILWLAYRRPKAMLFPVAWMVFLIAPVMPVFASSHHLYLPGVGTVLLITAGLAIAGGALVDPRRPLKRITLIGGTIILMLHAIGLSVLTWAMGFTYTRGTLVEDIVMDDVLTRGPALQDGDHLFFINMPVVSYYAIPAIESQLDFHSLEGHALTFAPDLAKMELPGEVEILDAHRIRVHSPAGRRYFEGTTGQVVLDAMRIGQMPRVGETIDAGLFRVLMVEGNDTGIGTLEFIFKERIDSPNYHFYYGSPQFLAYPLDVAAILRGEALATR